MRSALLLSASLLSATLPSLDAGAATGNYVGGADCRISDPHKNAGYTATWEGACKAGYAEGAGFLQWFLNGKLQDVYEGNLVQGLPGGSGHLLTAQGVHYVGNFVDGHLQGPGTRTDSNGNKMVGTFEAGRPVGVIDYTDKHGDHYHGGWNAVLNVANGQGSEDYALGGRYEGEWLDGKAVSGTIIYPNGIKRQAMLNDSASRPAATEPDKPASTYAVRADNQGSRTIKPIVAEKFNVPPALSYSELNADDQQRVRFAHPILQADDTPPYPVGGPREIARHFAKMQGALRVEGYVEISVLIDADGTAKAVTIRATPDEKVTNFVAAVLINAKYTPAICGGQPCAMSYPFRMQLSDN